MFQIENWRFCPRKRNAAGVDAHRSFPMADGMSLVATLRYAGRVTEELPHIRWLLKAIASESLLLRYAVQAAKSNGDQPLVKDVIELDLGGNTHVCVSR